METRQNEVVSYIAHEGEMARMERVNSRQWVIIIILIVALIATNAAWLWYENQFIDEVTITQENDNGYNNYIGNDGNISNSEQK